jgi:hypothetical protein
LGFGLGAGADKTSGQANGRQQARPASCRWSDRRGHQHRTETLHRADHNGIAQLDSALARPVEVRHHHDAVLNRNPKPTFDGPTSAMKPSVEALLGVSPVGATFYKNLKFNLIADIAPVASLTRNSPSVMVVNPSFPAKNVT